MKTVIISQEVFMKMQTKAQDHILQFNGNGYGHNNTDSQVIAWMSEYAVRNLYREGGVNCHQNIKDANAPDLTIPVSKSLATFCNVKGSLFDEEVIREARHEEVKCWKSHNWLEFGCTVRPHHAEKYERKGRARVWFCEVDMRALTVIVHGFKTPADILQSPIIETGGRYGGLNHQVEVLNHIGEIMPWIEEDKDGWF